MAKGGIADKAVGRADIYRMDPLDLRIKEGWNSRDLDTDTAQADLDELARSIAEVGVKQPLTVVWENGNAFITDGHRRYHAAMRAINLLKAEIKSVPVQTEDRYASEADRIFSQIVRNSGKPLLPIEQAKVFKRLLDFGWTETDIARKSGLNRQYVVQLLELQAAPEEVTTLVKSGAVAATLAIQTVKRNKGDMKAAAADLEKAVETAKASGKSRATAKHMADKPPSARAQLKAILEGAEIRDAKDKSGRMVIVLIPDEYAKLRVLAGM